MQNKSLIFMIDASGSMATNGRNDALNVAMDRLKKNVFDKVGIPADLNITYRVLKFQGDNVGPDDWMFGSRDSGIPIDQYIWFDMSIGDFKGATPTGEALMEVMNCFYINGDVPADPNQNAPIIILISDGESTGKLPLKEAIAQAKAMKCGREVEGLFARANRIAIGIDVHEEARTELKEFGRLSRTLKARGVKSYYDADEDVFNGLIEIIRHSTGMPYANCMMENNVDDEINVDEVF